MFTREWLIADLRRQRDTPGLSFFGGGAHNHRPQTTTIHDVRRRASRRRAKMSLRMLVARMTQ